MNFEITTTTYNQLVSVRDINVISGLRTEMKSPDAAPLVSLNSSPISAGLVPSFQRGPAADMDATREHEDSRRHVQIDSESALPFVDRDLLLKLLCNCLPLSDAAIATTALLDYYGTYADAVAAPFDELRGIKLLGEVGAGLLKCVHAAAIHLATAPIQRSTGVDDWKSLLVYLNTTVARERNEVIRVLYLNRRNLVISDQKLAEGTVGGVHVCIRSIAEKSLRLGATAILIIHNHPSGDPLPSPEDWTMTKKIEKALALFDINLHDHIIVGRGQYFSLSSLKFLYNS